MSAPLPAVLPAARNRREVEALVAKVAARFPGAVPRPEGDAARTLPPVSTGIADLDAALPGGGLPRGRLTAWAPGGGAAVILRSACRTVLAAGERAAWVEGTRSVGGWTDVDGAPDCAPSTAGQPTTLPLLVQSGDPIDALRCAECLLGAAAFALVVLEPAPGGEPVGTQTVRLVHAARAAGTALVVLTERRFMSPLRIISRLDVHGVGGVRWRRGLFGPARPAAVRVEVRAHADGWTRRATAMLGVRGHELRDGLDADRDRRGPNGRPGGGAGPGAARNL